MVRDGDRRKGDWHINIISSLRCSSRVSEWSTAHGAKKTPSKEGSQVVLFRANLADIVSSFIHVIASIHSYLQANCLHLGAE